MAANKQTLYELLGVSQNAALAEIKAAHRARTRQLIIDNGGLTRDEVSFQLQVLDVALNTLSVQWSRDTYDAELAALASPYGSTLPAAPRMKLPSDSGVNALHLADDLYHTYKNSLAESDARNSLVIFAESAATSASVLKKGFRVLAGFLVLFAVLKISMAIFAATHQADLYAKEKASAEEKVIIQDYYQKHGVRPASGAEAEMLEAQARRERDETNKAQAERQRQEQQDRLYALQGRREGEQVTRNLEIAEAQARANEERERRQREWAKQQAEQQAEQQAQREEEVRQQGLERVRREVQLARERAREGQWRQTDSYQER